LLLVDVSLNLPHFMRSFPAKEGEGVRARDGHAQEDDSAARNRWNPSQILVS
jgi:hypothetical protein